MRDSDSVISKEILPKFEKREQVRNRRKKHLKIQVTVSLYYSAVFSSRLATFGNTVFWLVPAVTIISVCSALFLRPYTLCRTFSTFLAMTKVQLKTNSSYSLLKEYVISSQTNLEQDE